MLNLARGRLLNKSAAQRRTIRHLNAFSSTDNWHGKLSVNDEVRSALNDKNKAVVALESTIITHGMPFPKNVECAIAVEDEIRKQGAVPATIGLLNGRIKVGLTNEEIGHLGNNGAKGPAIKTSRRDLPYVMAQRFDGGTTVSATILIAARVGIKIFATGGIGGVHRMGESSMDVSADLLEMGRNNVTVVSSGVKSILDIGKTLEYLETQGVFVAAYGADTVDFPAFYTRDSGHRAPYNLRTPLEVARVVHNSHELRMESGQLIAVPVPKEHAMDRDAIEAAIDEALREADKLRIGGKEITPFLLTRIAAVTDGESVETNVALVKNNAAVAAQIAVELSRIERNGGEAVNGNEKPARNRPFVIGGSVLDRCVSIKEQEIRLDGRMHRGKFTESAGGVARNVCEALCKLHDPPRFLTAIGTDVAGNFLRASLVDDEDDDVFVRPQIDDVTSQCAVVLDAKGECRLLVGQMAANETITSQLVEEHEAYIRDSPLLVTDANPSRAALDKALEIAQRHDVPVFFEPTDVPCSIKPFESKHYRAVKYISPNLMELREIAGYLGIITTEESFDTVQEVAKIARKLCEYVDNIIVTMGAAGLLVARRNVAEDPMLSHATTKDVRVRHYCAPDVLDLVNVSGAGDCLAAGIIASMLRGYSEEMAIAVGLDAARAALRSLSAVPKVFRDINWGKSAYYTTI